MIKLKEWVNTKLTIEVTNKGNPYEWEVSFGIYNKKWEVIRQKEVDSVWGTVELSLPKIKENDYRFTLETDEGYSDIQDLIVSKSVRTPTTEVQRKYQIDINNERDEKYEKNIGKNKILMNEFYMNNGNRIKKLESDIEESKEKMDIDKWELMESMSGHRKELDKKIESSSKEVKQQVEWVKNDLATFQDFSVSKLNKLDWDIENVREELNDKIDWTTQSIDTINKTIWDISENTAKNGLSLLEKITRVEKRIPSGWILDYEVDDEWLSTTILRTSEKIDKRIRWEVGRQKKYVSYQNMFDTIAVLGQDSLQPSSPLDELTFVAGSNITITTDAETNTITFASTGSWSSIDLEVEGTPNVDQTKLNLKGGTNMTITDNGDGSVTFDATGGSGAVDSVNWQTGVVVLDQDDIWDGTTYKQYSQTEKTKLSWIEDNADVTDTTNVTSAGALMDSEVTSLSGIKSLTVPDNTTISTFWASLVDDASAGDARTTLGLWTSATVNTWTTNGTIPVIWSWDKLPASIIPDLFVSDYLGNFTDTTAALANAGVQASQRGDRFTVNTSWGLTYVVINDNPTTLADVVQIKTPTGDVASVNGQTGVVTLDTDDIWDTATNRYTNDTDITRLANTSWTNTWDQTITLTGDVTGSGTGSFWATIANDAVTNAKLANMTTKTYKGRTAGTTGDPEDVPVATLKTDLNLVKWDVGLWNVDNTSDADKPISTATQAALDDKDDLPNIVTTSSSATPTPTGDYTRNKLFVTALAVDATIAAPTWTPADWNVVLIRIQDNGTARAIWWNAIYRGVWVTLPTTTIIWEELYVWGQYNASDSTWDIVYSSVWWSGGSTDWGDIGWTLSDQTDLQTALNAKANDADVVKLTWNQTVGGVKTFSSTIVGSINGNAWTVTDGVYTTWNQTIWSVKTFSSFPVTPSSAPTTDYQVANKKYVDDNIWWWGWSYKFAIAWTIWATGTNVANTILVNSSVTFTSCNLRYWTAWSGTLTVDINKNWTTLFSSTKPSITTTNQTSVGTWTLTTTTAVQGDLLTIDIDAVPWTKGMDLYVELFYS